MATTAFRCAKCGEPVEALNQLAMKLMMTGKPATCKRCQNGFVQHWSKATYAEYIKSDWWLQRRKRALKLAAYACQICKSKDRLGVHHNCYDRLGSEIDSDLFVVCAPHHDMIHGMGEL